MPMLRCLVALVLAQCLLQLTGNAVADPLSTDVQKQAFLGFTYRPGNPVEITSVIPKRQANEVGLIAGDKLINVRAGSQPPLRGADGLVPLKYFMDDTKGPEIYARLDGVTYPSMSEISRYLGQAQRDHATHFTLRVLRGTELKDLKFQFPETAASACESKDRDCPAWYQSAVISRGVTRPADAKSASAEQAQSSTPRADRLNIATPPPAALTTGRIASDTSKEKTASPGNDQSLAETNNKKISAWDGFQQWHDELPHGMLYAGVMLSFLVIIVGILYGLMQFIWILAEIVLSIAAITFDRGPPAIDSIRPPITAEPRPTEVVMTNEEGSTFDIVLIFVWTTSLIGIGIFGIWQLGSYIAALALPALAVLDHAGSQTKLTGDALIIIGAIFLLISPLAWASINARFQEWKRGATEPISSDPPDSAPRPPTKVTIGVLVAATVAVNLFIVWTIAGGHTGKYPKRLIETLILFIILAILAMSLARSPIDLIGKALFFSAPLFSMFGLLVYQTPITFWITAAVLAVIVIRELGSRFQNLSPFMQLFQSAGVFLFFMFSLLTFTLTFLPTLATTLDNQFDYVTAYRLRGLVSIYFLGIAVVATLVHMFQHFRPKLLPLLAQFPIYATPSEPLFSVLYPAKYAGQVLGYCMACAGYVLATLFRILGLAIATFLHQFCSFVITAIYNTPLWHALFSIATTAGLLLFIAADVLWLRQPLELIILSPITDLVFHFPGHALDNASLAIAYIGLVAATTFLFYVWLPRGASQEIIQRGFQRLAISASAIYLCAVVASLIYYPCLNWTLTLHSEPAINYPGLFTIGLLLFGAYFSRAYVKPGPAP